MNNSIEGKVKPHCLAKHIGQIEGKYKARKMEITYLRIKQADLFALHQRKYTNKQVFACFFPFPRTVFLEIKLLCSCKSIFFDRCDNLE